MLPTILLLGIMVGPAVGQQEPPGDAAKQELRRLQGSWRVEALEENGEKKGAEDLKDRTIFFGGDAFLVRQGGKLLQMGVLKFDPSKTPKSVNANIIQGGQKGDVLLGIYERDGDSLKLCMDTRGDARPKEFKSEPDSGRVLMICKRLENKDNQPDLSGVYRSESTEIDGSKHVAEAVIERVGDAYMVSYRRGNAISFLGVGIRKGDVFCMSWINQGQVGVTLYQIEKGQRLVGQYTRLGPPGVLSQEILTRKDFD